jgi:hypothetical protein
MRFQTAFLPAVGFSIFIIVGAGCQPSGGKLESDRPAATSKTERRTEAADPHKPFSALLAKYVKAGKVDYKRWAGDAGDRKLLEDYLKTLAKFDSETLDENGRKAFWINAYNAITLAQVLDRYPLQSVNFDEMKDPKAKDFWNIATTVGTRSVTLNDIENVILRPVFKDPRIHFAINCASNGCPILQSKAFDAAMLDAQLDEATKTFLSDTARGATFDEKTGGLTVSPIFKWYAADFGDVAAFVARFRPDLPGKIKKVEFQGYDWRLNDGGGAR